MVANKTPGTHNPRISAQTVTNLLRDIGERPPYTIYVVYAAFLFWPSIQLLLHKAKHIFSRNNNDWLASTLIGESTFQDFFSYTCNNVTA